MDGAVALAVPTKFGQEFSVKIGSGSEIKWRSLDEKGEPWFTGSFSLFDFKCIKSTDEKVAQTITQLLKSCVRQNSDFLSKWKGQRVETKLEFPKDWGLGSSSTMIAAMADWAEVNPFQLLVDTIGGSGYDIACANADGPITYQIDGDRLHFREVNFQPPFSNHLFFVYLDKKQNSRLGIEHYRKTVKDPQKYVTQISEISEKLFSTNSFSEFEAAIEEHEKIIAEALQLKPAKSVYFEDYWGNIKSLGAWGGDFVLVTSNKGKEDTRQYFKEKGFSIFYSYDELIYSR